MAVEKNWPSESDEKSKCEDFHVFHECSIALSLFLIFLNTFSLIQLYCKATTLLFLTFPPLPQIPSYL